MVHHFILLRLGDKNYKEKVSTDGCSDVDDFKGAIKNKFPPLLNSYASHQLRLFQPDGITEIYPQTSVADLKEIPWKPMVVTVEELPARAPSRKSRKQLRMTAEESCIKLLDAIANQVYLQYDFRKSFDIPIMSDLLDAKNGQFGKPSDPDLGSAWWDYRKVDDTTTAIKPLLSIFTQAQWDKLQSLNQYCLDKIYDGQLFRTCSQKPIVVIPHSDFTEGFVHSLKSIAANIGIVPTEDDLIVMDESDLRR